MSEQARSYDRTTLTIKLPDSTKRLLRQWSDDTGFTVTTILLLLVQYYGSALVRDLKEGKRKPS